MKERVVVGVNSAFVICALTIALTSPLVQTNVNISTYGLISATDYYVDSLVTDFRATMNNIIQNAVTPAKIHLSAGTFNSTAGTGIKNYGKNDIEIVGAGMGQTIILIAPNQPYASFVFRFDTTSSNWYVHDFTIDGNGNNQGTVGHNIISAGWASGTPFAGLLNSTFERIEIINPAIGGGTNVGKSFSLYDCSYITIRFCKTNKPTATDPGKIDVAMERCSGMLIHDNEFVGGGGAIGFYTGTHDCYAIRNTCTDQGRGGMALYRNAWNNRVSGNTIINTSPNNTSTGIYITNANYAIDPCYDNIIDNNTIDGILHGIWINAGSYGNKVFLNTINAFSTVGSSYGLHILGHDNEIDGNIIQRGYVGICIDGDATYPATGNRLAYNTVSGATIGYYIAGSGASNNAAEANSINAAISIDIDGIAQAGNRFSGNTLNSTIIAIRIGSGANDTVFEANTLLGSTTIQDSGANTIFRDHIVNPIAPIPTLPPLPDLTGGY